MPKKCPAQSGNAYFLAQIFKILAGELRYLSTEPVLRARTPVTAYIRNALSQKISRSSKGSWVRIKENKPTGKNMNKKTKTKQKKCAKKTKMATSRFKLTPGPLSMKETSSKTTGPPCRWITNRSNKINSLKPFSLLNATCGQKRALYH